MNMTEPDWLLPALQAVLPPARAWQVQPWAGGGNHRVFRVQSSVREYLVKWYFPAGHDPGTRLNAEWSFATFAWQRGVRKMPEPIACDPVLGFTVFEFVAGRKLEPGELSAKEVMVAADFLAEVQPEERTTVSASLPAAAESCFSLEEHLRCVRQRLDRIRDEITTGEGRHESAVRSFLHEGLLPAAESVERQIRERAAAESMELGAALPDRARIVSPSDFGFHNALRDANGQWRFFDFEYAGWDDPAKTACDFVCQVAVPVPPPLWHDWFARVTALTNGLTASRIRLLLPWYRLKWCCIVLNPLLAAGRARRQFSRGTDAAISDAECLQRAERILAAIDMDRV
jgi:hypothetical protein